MTPRERLIKAINFQETDRPPHFEQMFELTEEAFGLNFPTEQQLQEASGNERKRLFERTADIYSKIVEKYQWDAVLVWRPVAFKNSVLYEFIPYLKKCVGPNIPVGTFIWGSAICIDTIKDYLQYTTQKL